MNSLFVALLTLLSLVTPALAQLPANQGIGVPNTPPTVGVPVDLPIACGTDGTVAINNALVNVALNGVVTLPACPQANPIFYGGTSTQIFFPSNSTLCGQGQGYTWLKQANGANLGTAQNPGQITNSGNTGVPANGAVLNSNITVCNLSIDGNATNNTTASVNGQCLYFLGVSNLKWLNVETTNCQGEAGQIDGNGAQAEPCYVTNYYSHDTNSMGYHLGHAERGCTSDGITTVNTGGNGIFADASQGVFINLVAIGAGCLTGGTFDGACSTIPKTCSVGNKVTSASTIAGSNILTFAGSVPTGSAVGQTIIDDTAPAGLPPNTTITIVGATTLTMSANAIGAGVASGDRIRTYPVNNPGGGGPTQAGYSPCPSGIFMHNVTAKSCSNWFAQNNQFGGVIVLGGRFSACTNWVVSQNSLFYPGNWDDLHFALSNNAPNYGETAGFTLVGAYLGSNTQTIGDAQSLGASFPTTATGSPSSRYDLYIEDGILGSVASATIAAAGTTYTPTNGNSQATMVGGTCTVVPTFQVTAAGGVPNKVDLTKVANTSGQGFCTVFPTNPVATSGTGTGLTLNLTWATVSITNIVFGDALTGHFRLPAFQAGLTLQSSDGVLGRTAIADASYQMLQSDQLIAFSSIAAARTVTLMSASAFPPGKIITLLDESGSVTPANFISLAPCPNTITGCLGTDNIQGSNSTQTAIATARGFVQLESDGVSNWFVTQRSADSQLFSATGTWHKVIGLSLITSYGCGQGGGGGGGAVSGVAGSGGAGGGSGDCHSKQIRAVDAPASAAVTITTNTNGGAAGAAGTVGGNTTIAFTTTETYFGGGGGSIGTTASNSTGGSGGAVSGAGQATAAGSNSAALAGCGSGGNGGNGVVGSDGIACGSGGGGGTTVGLAKAGGSGAGLANGPGGGSGGGTAASSGVTAVPGKGGVSLGCQTGPSGGATTGTVGSNGGTASAPDLSYHPGCGGAGGGGGTTTGGNGSAGTASGGGGGGGSVLTSGAGTGGQGGSGFLLVTAQ